MQYFILQNGKGAYVEAHDPEDYMCKQSDKVMVPKRPDEFHDWDIDKKEWILNKDRVYLHRCKFAKKEIDRIVKFLSIPEKEKETKSYIGSLRQFVKNKTDNFPSMPMALREESFYD